MEEKAIKRIFSTERLEPYLRHHDNDFEKSLQHYKANIKISEAFYPLLSVLEIGLRNNFDNQLKRLFQDDQWHENSNFIKIVSRFQIERISEARTSILREKKQVTSGKIISELSFGFWTSLLDSRFERTLWKNLRLSFPNCPKSIRKRKTMSSKFNGIRKLRNRIFHHEPISWNIDVLINYRNEIVEGIDWLDKDLVNWCEDLMHVNQIIEKNKLLIR
jgi:hypothetical protein